MAKPVRQITPPAYRIWLVGILATVLASGLNYGWWWLCQNVFVWQLQVPKTLNVDELVPLTETRVLIATGVAGLLGIVGALILGKLVIGPRIWWLIISTAAGLASIYGILTLTTLTVTIRSGLVVMHVLAMVAIIPLLTKALTIGEPDVDAAVRKHTEYKDAKASTEMSTQSPAPATVETHVSPINATVVIPQFDLATVLDKSEDDALATVAAANFEARVISRDGQMFPLSTEFREDRVNIEVTNGIVTNAHIG